MAYARPSVSRAVRARLARADKVRGCALLSRHTYTLMRKEVPSIREIKSRERLLVTVVGFCVRFGKIM
jgi:hypothetical protein